MHTYLVEMLECPVCHGRLKWEILEGDKDRIESAEARCETCSASYPVREGIGLFLTPDLPREDLWEQADSGLIRYLHEHPALEKQLMDAPLETLNPADRFFRALVLESNGNFDEAQGIERSANEDMYTREYWEAWNRQLDYVIEQLSGATDPIVDLASGRGYLVEKMIRELEAPIVATDFSPSVLRRDRQWLEAFQLDERVSLLAFDARRTPFKDGSAAVMTTNLGLPNIREPGRLLRELHRIVSGLFLGISFFYPEEDEANKGPMREAGLDQMLYREAALESFTSAGWEIEVRNVCMTPAYPTPASEILEGARIDSFPVQETRLEWCVLEGTAKPVVQ